MTKPPFPLTRFYKEWNLWADALIKWLRHPEGELGALQLPVYSMGTLPPANQDGMLIFVSDAEGGGTPAFSEGGVWRRTADRAQVSLRIDVPSGTLVLTGNIPTV